MFHLKKFYTRRFNDQTQHKHFSIPWQAHACPWWYTHKWWWRPETFRSPSSLPATFAPGDSPCKELSPRLAPTCRTPASNLTAFCVLEWVLLFTLQLLFIFFTQVLFKRLLNVFTNFLQVFKLSFRFLNYMFTTYFLFKIKFIVKKTVLNSFMTLKRYL